MVKNHLKRISAPRTWNIHRKKSKFIAKPSHGAHPAKHSITLSVLLIENLKLFSTKKEVKYAIRGKGILLNQKPVTDPRCSIGLFDTIFVPGVEKAFRMIIDRNKKLTPVPITAKESQLRISKIANKISSKGNKPLLTTKDGRVLPASKDPIDVGDSILIEVPSQKILSTLKFEKGSLAYILEGKHTGLIVKIDSIKDKTLYFVDDKIQHQTRKDFAMVVGKTKPEIQIIQK